jgi:hypothetical protein
MAKNKKDTHRGLSDRELVAKYEGHRTLDLNGVLKVMLETKPPVHTRSKKSKKDHGGLPDLGKLPDL